MQVGIMVTNGGPHPADKWADMTTETILGLLVDASPDDASPEAAAARQAKRDLRPKLFSILNIHHGSVQAKEKRQLADEVKHVLVSREHVKAPLDVEQHMQVIDRVFAALAETPWKDHFAKPDVAQIIRNIVGQHTADVMHIERRWHHDRLEAASKKGA